MTRGRVAPTAARAVTCQKGLSKRRGDDSLEKINRRFFQRVVEPCKFRSVATRMAGYARDDGRSPAGGLALHLFLYLAVAGGLGFGAYHLFQPVRIQNPGLAAYKPPPATAITRGWSTNRAASHSADVTATPVAAPPIPEPETDARSTPQPPITGALVPAHRPPKVAKTSNRHVRAEPLQPEQQAVCIPGYDSSGAQTHAC